MKNGFLKRLLFFGTKLLGNKDAKALGDSLNGPQNQPVYRLYSAECCQRIHSKYFSYNGRISHRIKLLKYISQHQRQCKT